MKTKVEEIINEHQKLVDAFNGKFIIDGEKVYVEINGEVTEVKKNYHPKEKIIEEYPDYKISEAGFITKLKTDKKVKPHYKMGQGVVKLSKDGKQHSIMLRNLMYDTFSENERNDKKVFHADGDKTNNDIHNLKIIIETELNFSEVKNYL